MRHLSPIAAVAKRIEAGRSRIPRFLHDSIAPKFDFSMISPLSLHRGCAFPA